MRLALFLWLMLLYSKAFSQEEAFYVKYKNKPLTETLKDIEKTYSIIFTYDDANIMNQSISINKRKRDLNQLLKELEDHTNLIFEKISERYVIIYKDTFSKHINKLNLVTVRSFLNKGIQKKNDGSYQIIPQELEILPGLTEPDVLESIQQLPGVLSPNETATGFFVRGGFSDQNRLIWDGINIYHKGHLFGMISPLNPNTSSSIEFINKGTNPRYGERLSSVIDITSRNKIPEKIKSEAGFNGLNADALIEVPIISNKLSLLASGRTSYSKLFETFTYEQLTTKVFESTKINQNPEGLNNSTFTDANLKLNYKPNENNSLFVSFILIDNDLDFLLEETDSERTFNDLLQIRNAGYSFGWNRKWSDQFSHNFKAFFSDYSLSYNFITTSPTLDTSFEKRNSIYDSGFFLEFDYKPFKNLDISVGYEYNLKDVAYAFLSSEGSDFILDFEDRTVQTNSVFSNLVFSQPNLIDVSIGARLNYYNELNEYRVEPRLQISRDVNKYLTLIATSEIKNQIINEIDETVFSDLSLENNVWRLSDGEDVPIKTSFQTSLGFIYNKKDYTIDVDSYYRKLNDISALSLGFLNPQSSGFNIGDQTVFGLDVFLKKNFKNFKTWVSYSFNNSENRFENLNDGNSFKSKTFIRHFFSTSLVYDWKAFQFSLGWRWQSGRPFTQANEVNGELIFDQGINTGELPNFHRLDFSTTYNFTLSEKKGLRGKLGLSVRNVYNRRSLISKEYRGNNTLNDDVEVIDRFSLGITPNLMFRLYW